jgi:hypothetical protein
MFTQQPEPGTAKSLYVEDNTFNYVSRQDGVVEAYNGTRDVMRYNTINTGFIGSHGADSSDGRGIAFIEIYRNTMTMSGCLSSSCNFGMAQYRGGTILLFQNSWTSEYSQVILLDLYRANPANGPFTYLMGPCDGTDVVDGNEYGTGRHCIDQFGTIFTQTLDGTHTHYPTYTFENRQAGTLVPTTVGNTSGASTRIIENADFFNQATTPGSACTGAFDGTCGVGVGTLAARPATCTGPVGTIGGVGYWATDQGSWNISGDGRGSGVLYKCTATNTWTSFYTPYTYPHPLQGQSPPGRVHLRRVHFL